MIRPITGAVQIIVVNNEIKMDRTPNHTATLTPNNSGKLILLLPINPIMPPPINPA